MKMHLGAIGGSKPCEKCGMSVRPGQGHDCDEERALISGGDDESAEICPCIDCQTGTPWVEIVERSDYVGEFYVHGRDVMGDLKNLIREHWKVLALAGKLSASEQEKERTIGQKILDIGHNNDCLFCAFKDKYATSLAAIEALGSKEK